MPAVKVLVTGGAGFIGSNLVTRLLDEGYAVRALDDFSTGRRENVDTRAELIEGDIDDEAIVREAVRGAQVVFHQAAAGSVARSVAQPLVTDKVNTHGTLTVLQGISGLRGAAGCLCLVEQRLRGRRQRCRASRLLRCRHVRLTPCPSLPGSTIAVCSPQMYGTGDRDLALFQRVRPAAAA